MPAANKKNNSNTRGCCLYFIAALVVLLAIVFTLGSVVHVQKENFLPRCYNENGMFHLCKLPPVKIPSFTVKRISNWFEEKAIKIVHFFVEALFHYFGSLAISDEINVPHLIIQAKDGTVEIKRDEHGIASVKAQTLVDGIYAHGYIHAQDRLYQMEIQRRLCSGRLSEIFGSKAKQTDKFVRALGFGHKENFAGFSHNNTFDFPYKSKINTLQHVNAYLEGANTFLQNEVTTFNNYTIIIF